MGAWSGSLFLMCILPKGTWCVHACMHVDCECLNICAVCVHTCVTGSRQLPPARVYSSDPGAWTVSFALLQSSMAFYWWPSCQHICSDAQLMESR